MQNVQISKIMPRSFMVSWNPPTFIGNTALTNYSVSIMNAKNDILPISCSSSIISQGCVVTPNVTSTVYSSLAPYSRYHVKVWASNILGHSGKESISTTTDETSKSLQTICIFG